MCPYPVGRAPSQRLKYEQYFESWREAGFEITVSPFWDEAAWPVLFQRGRWLAKMWAFARGSVRRVRDVSAIRRADLVYLHLEALPLGPPVVERWMARSGVPMVYDLDDLVYLPHSSAANFFMRWLRRRGKVAELVGLARHTIVCTDHLAAFAARRSARVTNISSTIDTVAYRPRPHRMATREVVVGWSGSHSTSPYLHLLDDVLRELQRREGIRIKVIGDGTFRLDGARVQAMEWRRESEVDDLSELDIGVYPLPDEEWIKGKSGLKALQYMALEIPSVVQRTPVNVKIVRHGENGLVAGSPEEWYDALTTLVRDPELRHRLGTAARTTVEERYSVRVTAPQYLRVLEETLANGGRIGT